MIIERDIGITADDGLVLRADVYRPKSPIAVPAILALGPYGKGVDYKVGYASQWDWMSAQHPNWLPGSEKKYMTWETVDPETWTSWGYACVRIDSRGAGRSPGLSDLFSPREIKDYYQAIEWVGTQPWCNGKVGLNGISYYAATQWLVAALQPPHLAAMIPWEGFSDFYRDCSRHGGIAANEFLSSWYAIQVLPVQHGNPRGYKDTWLGQLATGPDVLTEDELAGNRITPLENLLKHTHLDQFYRDRTPDLSKIQVPFLSSANWGGAGLHGRGNFEAFTGAALAKKWLEVHPGRHEEEFYLEDAMQLQRQFFDHFLKDEDNGWNRRPQVQLRLRYPSNPDGGIRNENEWPLKRTQWTSMFLSAADMNLTTSPVEQQKSVTFSAMEEELLFSTTFQQDTEISGPLAAKLFISSTTSDADLFLTLQAFSPEGVEVEFQGAVDPHTPLSQGWQRASHRRLDSEKSLHYRPFHSHDATEPLTADEVYEIDIEIWPTHIILPAGYTLALRVAGKDFARPAPVDSKLSWRERGSGPFLHMHPDDRGSEIYRGKTTLHTGKNAESYLLLPIIPTI